MLTLGALRLIVRVFSVTGDWCGVTRQATGESCKLAGGVGDPGTEDGDPSSTMVADSELRLIKVGKEIGCISVAQDVRLVIGAITLCLLWIPVGDGKDSTV